MGVQAQELPAFKPVLQAGHITVVETVYHQRPGKEPTACESGFVKRLKSGLPVRVDEITVGRDRITLDVVDASMIVIKNLGAGVRDVNPTESELLTETLAVVHVCAAQPTATLGVALVPPNESARFQPFPRSSYEIFCVEGVARVEIHIYPK